ncbi:MAG TPA: hypothetical protein VFG59_09615 [Anaeromyxobacter sp.]|nr:hypothetical protein [Anaeromyxobacter sp.]
MTAEEWIAANPFPGLRPFRAEESDRFFGRDRQIADLAGWLEQRTFVSVVGDSGCGKSSLVLAGLLAKLRESGKEGTEWRPVVMHPGTRPVQALAKELSPCLGGRGDAENVCEASVYGRLSLGGLGLAEVVRLARLPERARILLVVDQFEEIFRLSEMTDPDEARAFVKLLLGAVADPVSPVSVIITMRAKEIGSCAAFRDLPEAVSRGEYLVPKLTLAQRKEAIVGPVTLREVAIAPRLVQRVLNDVRDDYDDLPVMQHALMRTWNEWAREGGGPLDLGHYETIGTAKGALSQHADETLASLGELAKVAEGVFRAITQQLAEGDAVRRALELKTLHQVVSARSEDIDRVVRRFQDGDAAFLVPPQSGKLEDSTVVDIVHEALIRQWKTLRRWADAESEKRKMLTLLIDAAERQQTVKDSLWRGRNLEKAIEWERTEKPTSAWAELYFARRGAGTWKQVESFLADSVAAERQERHRERRLRLLGYSSVIALVVVVGAMLGMRNLARQEMMHDLEARARHAQRSNPALAARLALRATGYGSSREANEVLRQSLAQLETAHLERARDVERPLRDVQLSSDGSLLVVAAGAGVQVLDSRTLDPRAARAAGGPFRGAWLVDANRKLLTMDASNSVQLSALDGQGNGWTLDCGAEGGPVYHVSPSTDGKLIALGCQDGAVRVFEAASPRVPARAYLRPGREGFTATALAFSDENEYLAVGYGDGVVRVFKLAEGPEPWIGPVAGEEKGWPLRHDGPVLAIAFHSRPPGTRAKDDPEFMVTSGEDRKVIAWQLDMVGRRLAMKNGRLASWGSTLERPATALLFAPRADAPFQLLTVIDKRVQLWASAESDRGGRNVRGHEDFISDVNATPDGEMLLTSSDDGTARLWSTRGGTPVAVLRHRAAVVRGFFGREEGEVITASSDGAVRRWRYSAPRIIRTSPGWVLSAALDPSGTRVAIGDERKLSVLRLGKTDSAPVGELYLPTGMDQAAYLSWSPDRGVLGMFTTNRLGYQAQPVFWDGKSSAATTPAWLMSFTRASFGPGGKEFVTSGLGGTKVWSTNALARSAESPTPESVLPATYHGTAAVSGDGNWAATYGEDGLRLWDLRLPVSPASRVLEGHEGEVRSLEFSPDSRELATSSIDGTVRVWPVDSTLQPKVLQAGQVRALACASFDPRGKRVVAGSADGALYVWDTEHNELIAILRRHGEGVNDVHFTPDGKGILSASDDGTVKLGQCEVCAAAPGELKGYVDRYAILDPRGERDLAQQNKIRPLDMILRALLPSSKTSAKKPGHLWWSDG